MTTKIGRGKALNELVKGSLEYTLEMIQQAFRAAYPYREGGPWRNVVDTFADYVVVRSSDLAVDEYYRVDYTRNGESYTFAAQSEWAVVQLDYTPKTLSESKSKRERLAESQAGWAELCEAETDKPRRIKAIGITADVVNANGRLYPADVLRAAVERLGGHLHESAGQGRLIPLLGEPEHPAQKSGRPNLLETVVKWDKAELINGQVQLEGTIIETSKGKDILAIMASGVMPGVSQRAYGSLRKETINGRTVQVAEALEITGYDLVLEPSDPNGQVLTLESINDPEEGEMDLKELLKLLENNPEFAGLISENVKNLTAEQAGKLEGQMRTALGLDESADLGKALQEAAAAKRTLDEQSKTKAIDEAIAEQTKSLPYSRQLNEAFVAAVKAAKPASAEAVKTLVEAKRAEYDQIAAAAKLGAMGYAPSGTVIEVSGNQNTILRPSLELIESMTKRGMMAKPREGNINQRFTNMMLEAFDLRYARELEREAKSLDEAEQTSDLSLPYSVSRTIIAAVGPQLVSSSVFDFGMMDASPDKLWYETYAGESGSSATVTAATFVADLNAYVALAHKRVRPGTVTLTNSGATVTYTEGSDYVVDYANGRVMALATITDEQSCKITYTYEAIREGEMSAIQRAKVTLASKTIEAAADRLATQISREAVVFSRSQLGWDATTRTLAALAKEIARKIDKGIFYLALASVLQVSSNSGGTWDRSSSTLAEVVSYISAAKIKVANRYYDPTAIVMSLTNADKLAAWDGFTAAGARADADLDATGFVRRINGLPLFATTEFTDDYVLVVNRELVMHRVFAPMIMRGPFPSYDSGNLVAAEQYYMEEFNATESPVVGKGAYVKLQD